VRDGLLILDVGSVLTPFDKFSPGRVVVLGDRIEAAGTISDVRIPASATRLDLPDLILAPGFIEPHVHGCGGFDVMDATPDSMNIISKTLAKYGTTSFLPTTVSAPLDVLEVALKRLADFIHAEPAGATPLGIHLEGPFLNVQKRGTHQPGNVCKPDPVLLLKWMQLSGGHLKLLTMAPELAGAALTADRARGANVVVAMGSYQRPRRPSFAPR